MIFVKALRRLALLMVLLAPAAAFGQTTIYSAYPSSIPAGSGTTSLQIYGNYSSTPAAFCFYTGYSLSNTPIVGTYQASYQYTFSVSAAILQQIPTTAFSGGVVNVKVFPVSSTTASCSTTPSASYTNVLTVPIVLPTLTAVSASSLPQHNTNIAGVSPPTVLLFAGTNLLPTTKVAVTYSGYGVTGLGAIQYYSSTSVSMATGQVPTGSTSVDFAVCNVTSNYNYCSGTTTLPVLGLTADNGTLLTSAGTGTTTTLEADFGAAAGNTAGLPVGTVTFKDGTTTLGTATPVVKSQALAAATTSGTFYSTSGATYQSVSADFDKDGLPDLLTLDNGSLYLLLGATNRGDLNTGMQVQLGYSTDCSSIKSFAVGDFNGDGYPDIAELCQTYNGASIFVLTNNGDTTFSGTEMSLSGTPVLIAAGDFDKDGTVDLVVAGATAAGGNGFTVIFNGASGFGSKPSKISVSTYATGTQLIASDLNNDGYPDLFILNGTSGAVSTFQNDHTGGFPATANYQTVFGGGASQIALQRSGTANFPNLVVRYTGKYATIPNNKSTTLGFGGLAQYPITNLAALTTADVTGDGIDDVVAYDGTNLSVYVGTTTGTAFSSSFSLAAANLTQLVAAGDFNGDGFADIFGIGYASNSGFARAFLASGVLAATLPNQAITAPGTHVLTATDPGTVAWAPGTATNSFNVPYTDTVTLSVSPNSPTTYSPNGTETLTATVMGNGAAPSGMVQFYNYGEIQLGTGTLTAINATTSVATLTLTLPVATYSLSAYYPGDGTYGSTGTSYTPYVVNQGTPVISWTPNPASIPYGTALSSAQLDATATIGGVTVPGSFSYAPGSGTVLPVGANTVMAAFTPTDTTDYSTPATVSTTITVTPVNFTAPSTAVGLTSAPQTAYVTLPSGGYATAINALTQGAANLDFKFVSGGTCTTTTVYPANSVCSVMYTFSPKAPGERLGAITLTSGATVVGTAYISGIGTGPLGVILPGAISTVAGNGTQGYVASQDTGTTLATNAEINAPADVVVDASGNLYIADYLNARIRKVTASTGFISTVAGNGTQGYIASQDTGTFAATGTEINQPRGIAIDGAGNLYIADTNNNRIRKVTAANGDISTVAGNGTAGYIAGDDTGTTAATATRINSPNAVAIDGAGNLYIADSGNFRVRKVAAATGYITTVAGNGTQGYVASQDTGTTPATSTALNGDYSISLDSANNLYIADVNNQRIRKVTASSGFISTVAGNGTAGYVAAQDTGTTAATAASLNSPEHIAVDAAGNLYIADYVNNRIRKVAAATGFISTVAGNGSYGYVAADNTGTTAATSTSLTAPNAAIVDALGNLYIADFESYRIRKVTAAAAPQAFPSTAVGTVSAAQTNILSNNGNAQLSVTSVVVTTVNFSLASTTCTGALAAGAICNISSQFNPQNAGMQSGNATATDDSLNIPGSQQTVVLNGAATPGTKTINFPQPATPAGLNSMATLTATTSNGDPVTYSVVPGTATISGSTITYTTAGTVTITASSAATANYNAATQATRMVVVNQATQTINFAQPATPVAIGSTATLSATGGASGSPVVFSVQSGPAMVSGTNGTMITYTSAGTVVIAANQAGNTNYSAAPTVTQSVVVSSATSSFNAGTVAVGGSSGTLTATVNIPNGNEGSLTASVVTQGVSGLDFALVPGGTCASQSYFPAGSTCTVMYSFKPTHPGTRYGAVVVKSSSGYVQGTAYLYGTGTGPQLTFLPASGPAQVSLGGGFVYPVDIAVDAGNNAYVAEQTETVSLVKKVPAGCASASCVTTVGGGFHAPASVAVDGAGNLYVGDSGTATVRAVPPGCTSSSCVTQVGGGYQFIVQVATDAAGNVYAADSTRNAIVLAPAGCTSANCTSTLGGGYSSVQGVTVGGDGTVYVADKGAGKILQFPNTCQSASCVITRYLTTQPHNLAVDGENNLYFTTSNGNSIQELPAGCSTSSCVVTIAAANASNLGVAVDGSNNVYVTDAQTPAVIELDLHDPPVLTFASTPVGSQSVQQIVTLTNNGNTTALAISALSGTNANFGGAATSCAVGTPVAAGTSCNLGVQFAPMAAGNPLSGSATLTDNNLNVAGSMQSIGVSGVATPTTKTITFSPLASPVVLGSMAPLSATASNGDPVTFSVLSGNATISGTTVTYTTAGMVTIAANSAAMGNYNAAPQVTQTVNVTQGTQTITFTAPASPAAIGTSVALMATGGASGNPVTFSVMSGPANVSGTNGSTLTYTGAGTVVVAANQAGNANYTAAATATQTVVVNQTAQAINFTAPTSPAAIGTSAALMATGGASGNPVTFSVVSGPATVSGANGSTLTYTGAGTVVVAANQTGNANYSAAPAVMQSVVVNQTAQTISFTAPASPAASGTSVTLAASGGASGNPVTFTVVSGPATVSGANGSTLTYTGAGTVVVAANQAGNANYSAAPAVMQSVVVNQTAQTISFTAPASPAGIGTSATLVASGGASGNPVTFTVVSGSATVSGANGSTLTYTGAGTVVVAANQAGNANYSAAPAVTQSVVVNQTTQSITFAPPVSPAALGSAATLVATGGTSNNPVVFSVVSGPATVSGANGATVTYNGAGTVVIAANQAGNTNFSAAPQATQTVTVSQGTQTINFAQTPTPTAVGSTATLSATGGQSGNAVVFSVLSGPATVSGVNGSTVTYNAAGTIVLAANQAGNTNYTAAPQVTQTVTVNQTAQTINFTQPASPASIGGSVTLVATGGASNNPVVFSLVSGPAMLSGATLTYTGAGTVSVAANQAGNANFTAATTVMRTVTVGQTTQSITFTQPVSPAAIGTTVQLAATGGASGNPVVFTVVSGPATVSGTNGSTLTYTGAGTVLVAANQTGNTNFSAATQVMQTVTVGKATPTIIWANPADVVAGTVLSGTQLNAAATDVYSASLPGMFAYNPASGTVLTAGVQTLNVTFTPADTSNYVVATKSVQLNVIAVTLTSLSTTAALLGDAAKTITLTGTGFVSNSVVTADGAQVPTTFVSGTTLTAVIPAADFTTVHNIPVFVTDPTQAQTTNSLMVGVAAAPLTATVTAPGTVTPASQPTVSFTLTNTYPVPVTATFAMTFTPAAGLPNDPTVLFANGTRTITVTVPAGSSTPVPLPLQSGSVAGTITITSTFTAGGATITPSGGAQTVTISSPAAVPGITSTTLIRNGNSLTVVTTVFSNTRAVDHVNFHFIPAPGQKIGTPDVTVDGSLFTAYYASAPSLPYGSAAVYTQTFTLDEDASIVGEVDVTVVNAVGNSQAGSAK